MANSNPSNKAAIEAKRAKSKEKALEVKRQIEYLQQTNQPITLRGVANRSGVSRTFIYGSKELKELIDSYKNQSETKARSQGLSSKRDLQKIKGLQSKLETVIARSKEQAKEISRLEKENKILKQHIESISARNVIPIGFEK